MQATSNLLKLNLQKSNLQKGNLQKGNFFIIIFAGEYEKINIKTLLSDKKN